MNCRIENKPVEIVHLDSRGNISQRTIFVKHIEEEKVIAFCTLREQRRIFFLDNILAAQKCGDLIRYVPKQVLSSFHYYF